MVHLSEMDNSELTDISLCLAGVGLLNVLKTDNSELEDISLCLAGVGLLNVLNDDQQKQSKKPRRPKRVWSRAFLLRRPQLGQYERLLRELLQENVRDYHNFLRVEPTILKTERCLGILTFST